MKGRVGLSEKAQSIDLGSQACLTSNGGPLRDVGKEVYGSCFFCGSAFKCFVKSVVPLLVSRASSLEE